MNQIFNLRELPKYETIRGLADRFPQLTPQMVHSWLVLLKSASDVLSAFEAHTAQYDLSPGRFTTLMLVYHYEHQGLTPSFIADHMGVTRATMTGLLDGLEHAGLILREHPAADRRAQFIRLTPCGRDRLEQILPHHFAQVARLMNQLGEPEQLMLDELLNKVRQNLSLICGESLSRPITLHPCENNDLKA